MERRHWDRLSISVPLFVRGTNPNGETFLEFATALNLSAGGALVAVRHDLDCGSAVSLEMPQSIIQPQLPRAATRFHAKVLRSLPTRHYFLLGLQFDRPLVPEPSTRKSVSYRVPNNAPDRSKMLAGILRRKINL
jgi:hypothetical protein